MPKIVDHDERRAHIARAVTNLIMRDGIDGATMREIAAEAGFAHGAIARYFPSKQSLITAAFMQVFEESENRVIAGVQSIRGLRALELMCRQLWPFSPVEARKARVVLAFWALAAQDPELEKLHQVRIAERRDLIRRFLREAQEDGELSEHISLEAAVDEVTSRNAGWQMMAVLVPEAIADERIEAALQTMLAGLRSTGAHSVGRDGVAA